ncbi:MAG TPA: C25 family cysteine peptidase [Pyrinomonadaceae bacterium]|nr:C25 family cysteine peptidase [Pyrinomonadaceae bacterium]
MKKVLVGLFFLCLMSPASLPVAAQRAANLKKARKTERIPVKFNKFQAFSDGQGVWLEWEMSLESNNLGFSVYRIDGEAKQLVNRKFISGAYLETGESKSTDRKYSVFDAEGDLNSTYYIESLNLNGKNYNSSEFSPKFADDLAAITGVSADVLKSGAETAAPTRVEDEKILPTDLRAEVETSIAQPDPTKQVWVAAQPGVKIGVKKEGFFRITRAQLQANGFDVNAPAARWQLFVNGNEQAVSIGGDGDFVEFYGRGLDTPEADAQTYFLVVGNTNGKRIASTVRRATGGRVLAGNYAQSITKKERFIYSQTFLNGDAENFFGSVVNPTGSTIKFDLTGVDFASPGSTVDVGVQGLTETAHQTQVTLNGHDLGTINGNLRTLMKRRFAIPTAFLLEGANSLKVNSLGGSSDVSLFESVKIAYARKYLVQQNSLSFYTDNYRAAFVGNFTSPTVRLFDVTNADSPAQITNLPVEQTNGAYRLFIPANRGRVMFAVEDSAVSAPDSITPNKPSALTTSNHNADLVIITHRNWTTQANDWAAFRRAQGLSVEVVDVEDVYDEFNFGVLSAVSIRSFLKYASGNWNTPPKYVLLIGDATYDPKNYTGSGNNNFIPTKLVDTVYTETGSDDALADFNDDGLTEMAIGRLPVRNGETVTQLLSKVTPVNLTINRQLYKLLILKRGELGRLATTKNKR